MVTLRDFREFLGFSIEGSGSRGLITIRRKPPIPQDKKSIDIPKNTRFYSNNISFYNPERTILSESSDFIPLFIVTNTKGEDSNLKPNQQWKTSLPSWITEMITIENTQAFSGGIDELPGQYFGGVGEVNLFDNQIQRALDVARLQLAKELGITESNEDTSNFELWLQDDPCIREALMMIAMYRLQQNTTQSLNYNVGYSRGGSFPEQEKYFRHRDFEPLMRQVRGLISHRRNVSAFMPTLDEVSGA